MERVKAFEPICGMVVIRNCVRAGHLKPIEALNEHCQLVHVYIPTEEGRRWFGYDFTESRGAQGEPGHTPAGACGKIPATDSEVI